VTMAWRDHIDAAFGSATAGDQLADAKQDMPIPDRIALARELLAGTGLVVGVETAREITPEIRERARALTVAMTWNKGG